MQEIARKKDPVFIVVIGVLLLIGALVVAAVLVLLPALSSLAISLQKFTPARGFLNSPWVGLQNYQAMLETPVFAAGLSATFTHAFFSALLLFLSSLVTGYLLLAIGKIRWLRHGLSTLLLLPLVIPGDLLAQVFLRARLYISPADTATALLIAAFCTIRYVGLPALLVSAAISRGKRTWSVPLLAGGVASIAVFTLLGRFDFSFMRQMPPTLYAILGLDTVAFRATFMTMQAGIGAAISTTLALITGVLMLVAAPLVTLMFARLFPKAVAAEEGRAKDRLIALVIPGGAALLAAIALAVAAVPGIAGGELSAYAGLPGSIVAALFGAAFSTALCYCLARPAACAGKAVKIIMACLLVVLTAVSAGNSPFSIGEFELFRSAGLMGTWFAIVLSGIGAVWGVWPLVAAARAMGVSSNEDWYRRMWKPSLALFAVQAALMMNNSAVSLVYINKASTLHPLLLLMRQMGTGGGSLNLALLALVTLAIPVALLLIVRTAFRDEESLGLFLPGR